MDTTALELLDARFNSDRLLVLTFNRPLDFFDTLATGFQISLHSPVENIAVRSVFLNPNQKEKLYLAADFPANERGATVRFSVLTARYGKDKGDTTLFLIGVKTDETPPKLVFSEPLNRRERAGFSDTLKLYFSEPVFPNFGGNDPGLLDSLGAPIQTVWSQPQANAFFFSSQSPLRQGEWYRLRLPAGAVKDPAGNVSADSASLSFRTYFVDSLGTVTGRLAGKPSGKIYLEFRELVSGWIKTEIVADTFFSLPLLSGKYFLSGFVDGNSNRKREPGSLTPFAFPEPAFFYPDTVFVRARFETEGIEVRVP